MVVHLGNSPVRLVGLGWIAGVLYFPIFINSFFFLDPTHKGSSHWRFDYQIVKYLEKLVCAATGC